MSLFARLLVLVAAVAAATAAVAEHRGWVDDRDAAIAAIPNKCHYSWCHPYHPNPVNAS
jgi:hypothetical protein